MTWARIRESDGIWLDGPLDEEPTAGEGEQVIVVVLGYPATVAWSPERRAFVDIVAPASVISVVNFKLLLTQVERGAIRAAAAASPEVYDFMDLLNSSIGGVSLAHPVVIQGVNHLADAGLLTTSRAAAVLAGTPPD